MVTSKQIDLVHQLLENLNDEDRLLCEPVINKLLELDYTPKKHKKSNFVIEFEKYGRVMIKLEVGHDGLLKFHMRYSACTSYPEIFVKAARQRSAAWVKRGQYWDNHDLNHCCGLCKGNPRLYHVVQDNGTEVDTCGGFTKYIQGVTHHDVPDILRMIMEQDKYFVETFS